MKDVYVVPHSHYDAAWLETYENYLIINHRNILDLLNAMKIDPDYKFVLDQSTLVRSFLERYPEEKDFFLKMVKEGRIEITCGMFVMPDVNLPAGEPFIRQILLGKRYYREELGVDPKVGWMIDVFGHHPQIPQLMAKSGFDSYVFGRVLPDPEKSEFFWKGIDGSKILCHWTPYHYVHFFPAPGNAYLFDKFAKFSLKIMEEFSNKDSMMVLCGLDFQPPQRHITAMSKSYNSRNNDYRLKVATPSEFFDSLDRSALPVKEGDFNPTLQGCYTTRIRVKQISRETESAMIGTENMQYMAKVLAGKEADARELDPYWEKLLLSHFHDVICGCHIQDVFNEAVEMMNEAKRAAKQAENASINAIIESASSPSSADEVSFVRDGISLMVFNNIGWVRSDVAEVTVGISDPDCFEVSVKDEKGNFIPVQYVEEERNPSGSLRKVRLMFVAEDIPAYGYSTYHVVNGRESLDIKTAVKAEGSKYWAGKALFYDGLQGMQSVTDYSTIENEFFKVKCDMWTGDVVSIINKENGMELIRSDMPLGNCIIKETDRGDIWEEYGPNRSGATVPTIRKRELPKPWEAKFSKDYTGDGAAAAGNVMAAFRFRAPFESGKREIEVRVYHKLRRIDFITHLVNNEEYVRYWALFPTTIESGKHTREIPFGSIETPLYEEYPAQNWIDLSREDAGCTILNRGISGSICDGEGNMRLSLLRSVKFEGHDTEGAFEKGVRHRFEYSLIPHLSKAEGWDAGKASRAGVEFNNPLTVVKVVGREIAKPSASALTVEGDGIIPVSIRVEGDYAYLRIYEAAGRNGKGAIDFKRRIKSLSEVNLIYDDPVEVAKDTERYEFTVTPFEIKAYRIEL